MALVTHMRASCGVVAWWAEAARARFLRRAGRQEQRPRLMPRHAGNEEIEYVVRWLFEHAG